MKLWYLSIRACAYDFLARMYTLYVFVHFHVNKNLYRQFLN